VNIFCQFGYSAAFWYIYFNLFGILHQDKSGNPGSKGKNEVLSPAVEIFPKTIRLTYLVTCNPVTVKMLGCQILLETTYQNGKNIYQMVTKHTKWSQNIPMAIKYRHKTPVKYSKSHYIYQHKALGPLKYTNWDFSYFIYHLAALYRRTSSLLNILRPIGAPSFGANWVLLEVANTVTKMSL
jgi:hypothetical protein